MPITHVYAGALVGDLEVAEQWYTAVLHHPPGSRPMAGLLEWHLTDGGGLQVFEDATRAGHSSLVLHVEDLDAEADRLVTVGVAHGGPQPGGGARILVLTDPDGNTVVLVGA